MVAMRRVTSFLWNSKGVMYKAYGHLVVVINKYPSGRALRESFRILLPLYRAIVSFD